MEGKRMKRGAISTTVKEGIDLVEKERKRQKAWKRLWELSDNAGKWGVGTLTREDGYAGKRSEQLDKIFTSKEKK